MNQETRDIGGVREINGPGALTDEFVLQALKKNGFKWLKNNCTDRVEPNAIVGVYPWENGFVVHYTEDSVILMTAATFTKIELPDDLKGRWIMVHWEELTDYRRPVH